MINPIGNLIGAVIMFGVLGFLPFYILARVLKAIGILRVPRRVELAGLDANTMGDGYPYLPHVETDFEPIERREAPRIGMTRHARRN